MNTVDAKNETRYMYDGMRVIQERNSGNVPAVAYTRGSDLSGRFEGAGGIGGLLARSHQYTSGSLTNNNYYHADGGGNVTMLIDTNQSTVATYRYDPYGNTISSSGSLASANVYRFSSKEIHVASVMYYYGYRFYDPNLQRWPNRDPIEEEYDINLYRYVYNSPLSHVDQNGLWGIQIGGVNIGIGDPNLAFDGGSWDDIGQGAQATLDGIDPFGDWFKNHGGYDPCDPMLATSRKLGELGRDAYLAAAGLRGLAGLGGTQTSLGRLLNGNRYIRIGPGRWGKDMVPRIAIGGEGGPP